MRTPPPRARQRGFTLLEMSIAVVVVAIAGAMVIDGTSTGNQAKVDLAASEVADAFRFARDESLRTGDLYGVKVRAGNESIELFRLDDSTVPPTKIFDVYHPVWKRLWDTTFDESSPASGVDIARSMSYRGTCTEGRFVVFRDGATPSCTDPIDVLLDGATVTLTHGSAVRTVTLEGFVGRVSVQ